MAQSQAEIESMVNELTTEAFEAFGEDMSAMFDNSVSVEQKDIAEGTIKELKADYKKLAAVCSVQAKGAMNGNFHVVFDKEGLFTLAGTFVMQPAKIIEQNRKNGSETEANEVADAVAEVGNLLVGSWDRIFREEMEEHGHFVQSGTFMGNPWTKSQDKIGLTADEPLTILSYEMIVDPLPGFKCAAIYPKSVFDPPAEEETAESEEETAEPEAKEEAPAEPEAKEEAPAEPEAKEEAPAEPEAKEEAPAEPEAKEEAPTEAEATEEAPAEPEAKEEAPTEAEATEEAPAEPEAKEEAQIQETAPEPVSEEPKGPVSEAIADIAKSPAVLPGSQSGILKKLTAKDVMQAAVVWANDEETIEQFTAKMQQNNTGYVLIGKDEQLSGIISKSDIKAAMSPYLQSMFAKWRTPLDLATLQIKGQWVMSQPVRTVRPDATVLQTIQTMTEHRVRSLPVVDEKGKVHGIVTVFDIFNALADA
ncbi:MAG: CBS domain-containing protein [Planctomycetota bacterium]|jgi:CBS domain-containing protein